MRCHPSWRHRSPRWRRGASTARKHSHRVKHAPGLARFWAGHSPLSFVQKLCIWCRRCYRGQNTSCSFRRFMSQDPAPWPGLPCPCAGVFELRPEQPVQFSHTHTNTPTPLPFLIWQYWTHNETPVISSLLIQNYEFLLPSCCRILWLWLRFSWLPARHWLAPKVCQKYIL